MIRATFVMEQHVGHHTYYQNLRAHVAEDPRIRATWVPVTYSAERSWLNSLPVSQQLRGSLIGRSQALRGLRGEPADVFFFFTQVPAMLVAQTLGKVPYVLSTDITPLQYDAMAAHYGHRTDYGFAVTAYKQHLNRRVFQKAAQVLPWTHWVRQSLVEDYGVSESRVRVIPIGVDLARWKPAKPRNGGAGPVRMLFVGGDFKRKGGELLLQVFRNLPAGSASLDIVTQSPVEPEPGVRVHRGVKANSEELVALFGQSHLFVLPTKADAFGIVAAEAMASGLPVVMSDIGGARDIVEDGVTGYLVPAGGERTLQERLSALVFDRELRERVGAAARSRAEQFFDGRQNSKRVVDALLDAARADPSAAVR
ncbi:MAG TPA: glycosyltransferase family 4 protein [Polyangiaceae bacterium]|nr:glycosyltransferase family 4 protein [Polyangiaceae bacterium]